MTAGVYGLLLLTVLMCGVLIGLLLAAALQGNREARAIDAQVTELVGIASDLMQLGATAFPPAVPGLESLLKRVRELRDRVQEHAR